MCLHTQISYSLFLSLRIYISITCENRSVSHLSDVIIRYTRSQRRISRSAYRLNLILVFLSPYFDRFARDCDLTGEKGRRENRSQISATRRRREEEEDTSDKITTLFRLEHACRSAESDINQTGEMKLLSSLESSLDRCIVKRNPVENYVNNHSRVVNERSTSHFFLFLFSSSLFFFWFSAQVIISTGTRGWLRDQILIRISFLIYLLF